MDIQQLLHPEIQNFITENLGSDSSKLALKKNPFSSVNYTEIIHQIISKKKAKDKLPTWFATSNIIYPEKISIEQTSSEITAKYKASLVFGENMIDCTGGFGIDDYYFAQQFKSVTHCEINTELSEIVRHNYTQLKTENIACISGDSSEILVQLNQRFDCIYIDPSRRNDAKGKVFMLADCLPNVVVQQDFYYQYSDTILIKTAPILDLQAGLCELKNVASIHIVAVENEVKELLWKIKKSFTDSPKIIVVNIEKEQIHSTTISLSKSYEATFSLPKKYLYEPNAALLKSGGFEAISELFGLDKLHQHSHLYTADIIKDFQGRRFEIKQEIPFQKSDLKKHVQNQKMNVTTRNFPLKVEEIKKKYKISDGGTLFAFFTTNLKNEKIVLLCTKI
ncbi:MAG TPA: class I SAM-dependent methyltransferase [Flavobacterium sp.]|uniref:class I SAM-dependent methyltransferase n=1 Tax=Flavobacterium sp. TaxID=239 RepID=UPI002B4AFBD2|nr:class I SAM-dependent methyltransferase [Flavobacterium sp.]HLO72615.1 class I SAM-dependent methyltransferase [Flavobacterium sp.]